MRTYGRQWRRPTPTPPLVQGSTRRDWREFDRRADALATALIRAGLGQQAKVAQYLYNSPEYLESIFASFKAGLVPVNTNYRYTETELQYLWDNADVEAVVFHAMFMPRVEALRPRLPAIRSWLWVDDGSAPCPAWATPYEQAAGTSASGPVRGPWGRGPDDLFLVYTGGTTGLPKGVMWRQDDLFADPQPRRQRALPRRGRPRRGARRAVRPPQAPPAALSSPAPHSCTAPASSPPCPR